MSSEDQSVGEIVAAGYRREDVERVVRLMHINEYKRRQAPVGIRVTHARLRQGLALSHHQQVPRRVVAIGCFPDRA